MNTHTLGRQLMAVPKSKRRCPFCLGELSYTKFHPHLHQWVPSCDSCRKTYWREGPAEYNLTFRKKDIIGVSPIPGVRAHTENLVHYTRPTPVRSIAVDVQGTCKSKRLRYAVTITQQFGSETPELLHQETVTSRKALRALQQKWDCFTGDAATVIDFLKDVLDPKQF